eukprot:427230_1
MIIEHNIPPELIINFDETSVAMVPGDNYTMAKKGSTTRCISDVVDIYPPEFDITYSEKHWSVERTKLSLLKNIIKPYVDRVRREYGDPELHALLLFDFHSSNTAHSSFYEFLAKENWFYKLVPATFTDICQPCDLSVNKPIKDIKVDLTLGALKPIHAGWVIAEDLLDRCLREIEEEEAKQNVVDDDENVIVEVEDVDGIIANVNDNANANDNSNNANDNNVIVEVGIDGNGNNDGN